MTNEEIVRFKLSLAAAWLENGHENLARDLVRSIIEKAEGTNE
jgi:Tfp pilus assembly protein FimV